MESIVYGRRFGQDGQSPLPIEVNNAWVLAHKCCRPIAKKTCVSNANRGQLHLDSANLPLAAVNEASIDIG